jgi:DNA-binding CsgD family transcriptional regulator
MKKQILLYGLALGLLIMLLKTLEYRFVILDHAIEAYGGMLAVIFTSLGIWLAVKLTKPKKEIVIVEKEVLVPAAGGGTFSPDEKRLSSLGISKREYEVLELIAQGLSNQEIADRLFVSLNTIKTHSSKLFEKLDVSRRTQAVQKAKELCIIP